MPEKLNEAVESPPDKTFKEENMVWTRVYYGRAVMDRILETIDKKQALLKRYQPRYMMRAAMAGAIIALMYLFTYQIKTDLGPNFNVALSNCITAVSFSLALVLIFYTNSELLTSNFMYFTVGRYYDRIKWLEVVRILRLCLVGNLIGIFAIAVLVWSCRMISPAVVENLVHTVNDKTVGSGVWLIFVKAIFANYFINVAVIISMQVKENMAKMAAFVMGVTIFAYMGYEHVVANSALFALALLFDPEAVSLLHIGKNFFLALAGNYVGGGLVIGWFYAYLNDNREDVAAPAIAG